MLVNHEWMNLPALCGTVKCNRSLYYTSHLPYWDYGGKHSSGDSHHAVRTMPFSVDVVVRLISVVVRFDFCSETTRCDWNDGDRFTNKGETFGGLERN